MEDENNGSWGLELSEATADPSISMIAEDVPTLTVATILGITALIVIAIVIVFVLGILIDCRQQRILDRKIGQMKRKRNQKRGANPQGDVIRIADNMEESSRTPAPAEILREIP
ncbi:uncharacterized protein LOC125053261 [Pieris napi]|uniref:Uncharacterized protein n=1 Tax=Pieris macdunnoughi TaxID=345717 RepID=A0A821MNI7_9NEOP|nr:uncharacterized protein LOC125053261 [Pieris napi]CAF4772740.1 unnamed protein product [Pieris macdunnoughi]